jgi:serine/threonine protein kinase
MLPDGNGIEFCKEIKSSPGYGDTPILFLSGLSEPEDKVRAFVAGGSDYIAKPFVPSEVLARVYHHYRIVCASQALMREKEELQRRNRQLQAARQETCHIFSALADQLRGKLLDNKYLLQERIGTGGFSVVYRATQVPLSRQVAVKVLHPVEASRREQRMHRFQQEIKAAARVHHPNVVEIIDAQLSSDGIPYLVMELLVGHSLSDELQPALPLPLLRCLQIAIPVTAALVEAHRVGVLHRDIKPANIFLHAGSGGDIPKILDFGLAKVQQEDSGEYVRVTQRGDLAGTLYYMSPEQITGEAVGVSSDVYSLGVTLYEMLTGQLPGDLGSEGLAAILRSYQRRPSVPPSAMNSQLPPDLDDVLLRALQLDPRLRPSMQELKQALSRVAVAHGEPRRPSSVSAPALA